MHRAGRVEECYGNLDEHYDRDRLRVVIDELKYSTDDERRNKPNPSKIPFNGNTRSNSKSRAAARMVPALSLRTYRVNFEFKTVAPSVSPASATA